MRIHDKNQSSFFPNNLLAASDPTLVELSTGPIYSNPAFFAMQMVAGTMYAVGFLIFAISAFRSKAFSTRPTSKWAILPLVLGVIMFIPGFFPYVVRTIGIVVYAIGIVWVGVILIRKEPAKIEEKDDDDLIQKMIISNNEQNFKIKCDYSFEVPDNFVVENKEDSFEIIVEDEVNFNEVYDIMKMLKKLRVDSVKISFLKNQSTDERKIEISAKYDTKNGEGQFSSMI